MMFFFEPFSPHTFFEHMQNLILFLAPLDLTIELYTMDTISGIAIMALCDVSVDSIGGQIKKQDGSTLAISDVQIQKIHNSEINTIVCII